MGVLVGVGIVEVAGKRSRLARDHAKRGSECVRSNEADVGEAVPSRSSLKSASSACPARRLGRAFSFPFEGVTGRGEFASAERVWLLLRVLISTTATRRCLEGEGVGEFQDGEREEVSSREGEVGEVEEERVVTVAIRGRSRRERAPEVEDGWWRAVEVFSRWEEKGEAEEREREVAPWPALARRPQHKGSFRPNRCCTRTFPPDGMIPSFPPLQ